MRILKNRIPRVIIQLPTRRDDHLVVTIQRLITHNEIEGGRGSSVGCGGFRVGARAVSARRGGSGRFANLHLNLPPQTRLAVVKRHKPLRKYGREFWNVYWSVTLFTHNV